MGMPMGKGRGRGARVLKGWGMNRPQYRACFAEWHKLRKSAEREKTEGQRIHPWSSDCARVCCDQSIHQQFCSMFLWAWWTLWSRVLFHLKLQLRWNRCFFQGLTQPTIWGIKAEKMTVVWGYVLCAAMHRSSIESTTSDESPWSIRRWWICPSCKKRTRIGIAQCSATQSFATALVTTEKIAMCALQWKDRCNYRCHSRRFLYSSIRIRCSPGNDCQC